MKIETTRDGAIFFQVAMPLGYETNNNGKYLWELYPWNEKGMYMNAHKISEREEEVTDEIMNCVNRLPEAKQSKLLNMLKTWVEKFPREFQRAECLEPVYYSTKDRLYKDIFVNFSAGGLFIETRDPISVNQKISLAFSFPNNDLPFKITGSVVRVDSDGVGIKFNTESQVQVEMLKNQVNEMNMYSTQP